MPKEFKKRPPVFISAETPENQGLEDILGPQTINETSSSFQTEPESANMGVESSLDGVLAPKEAEPDPLMGWQELTEAQQTGKTFLISRDLYEEGVSAFWRRTRVLEHFKWKQCGKWTNSLTHQAVLPEPKYYKDL